MRLRQLYITVTNTKKKGIPSREKVFNSSGNRAVFVGPKGGPSLKNLENGVFCFFIRRLGHGGNIYWLGKFIGSFGNIHLALVARQAAKWGDKRRVHQPSNANTVPQIRLSGYHPKQAQFFWLLKVLRLKKYPVPRKSFKNIPSREKVSKGYHPVPARENIFPLVEFSVVAFRLIFFFQKYFSTFFPKIFFKIFQKIYPK